MEVDLKNVSLRIWILLSILVGRGDDSKFDVMQLCIARYIVAFVRNIYLGEGAAEKYCMAKEQK